MEKRWGYYIKFVSMEECTKRMEEFYKFSRNMSLDISKKMEIETSEARVELL